MEEFLSSSGFLTNDDLKEIWTSYDAFYFANKYGEATTHKDEFSRLEELLKDEASQEALKYIKYQYDSYYKNEFELMNDNNPFYYLQCRINEVI